MQYNLIVEKSFGTHDGSFHADEVTACALLQLFGRIEATKIVRSRDEKELARCEYVCDVGGIYDPAKKRFDHHQITYQGLLSSTGMVLLHLKEERVIDTSEYQFLNQTLILGVDAKLAGARLALCLAVKYVLAHALAILGVNAPEKM